MESCKSETAAKTISAVESPFSSRTAISTSPASAGSA